METEELVGTALETEEILGALDAFVRDRFEIAADDPDYSADTDLFDYGYVDSLGATEIILFIEERFGCEITQRDITKYPMNTVREIAGIVAGKLK